MISDLIILATEEEKELISNIAQNENANIAIHHVNKCEDLELLLESIEKDSWCLISCGTSIIVPANILNKLDNNAVNIHAASPGFPGRDPHHFAIYHDAERYGATAHIMHPEVDSGPIMDIEWFDIQENETPYSLLERAKIASKVIIRRLVPKLIKQAEIKQLEYKWSDFKTSRKDFLKLCRVSPLVSKDELEKRKKAVELEGRKNLYINLHGSQFYFDKSVANIENQLLDTKWNDFTEELYRITLQAAKDFYSFKLFTDNEEEKPHILLRHDVDFSVHRAYKISLIEHELNIKATYFIMLNSQFYNLLDPVIIRKVRDIISLGHDIGLHFCDEQLTAENTCDEKYISARILKQKSLLEEIIEKEVAVISFHNPDSYNILSLEDKIICNLINVYSDYFKENYKYCSDSNGYWRYESIHEVIASRKYHKLQILTHPAWWTPEPMSPRDRIERCIYGRALSTLKQYDQDLIKFGRENIK